MFGGYLPADMCTAENSSLKQFGGNFVHKEKENAHTNIID